MNNIRTIMWIHFKNIMLIERLNIEHLLQDCIYSDFSKKEKYNPYRHIISGGMQPGIGQGLTGKCHPEYFEEMEMFY